MNPALLALSETKLIAEIEDSEVNVPGYNVVRCDAENRNTGGVMLYIINKEGDKYREFSSKDYSKFHIGDFFKAVEERIEHIDKLDVNVRAEKFIQNIVNALDIVALKKKFKIPKIWEGK